MRTLIIDDYGIVRRGIIALLREHFPEMEFGEAEDVARGYAAAVEQEWDLVLLDVDLQGRSGLDLIRQLRQAKPGLPVLVVSAHAEKDYAMRAIKLGAAGYVAKQSAAEVLLDAVRRVLAGGLYVTPELAEQLAGSLAAGAAEDAHEALSNRELQVLKMIALGKTLREIGSELALSPKTVATYRARISEKMGMLSNVDLTRYAMRHGLIE